MVGQVVSGFMQEPYESFVGHAVSKIFPPVRDQNSDLLSLDVREHCSEAGVAIAEAGEEATRV